MKTNLQFTEELFRIVNGALRLDTAKVRNYTEFLAEKLEGAGEEAVARRLRKLLKESDHMLHPVSLASRSLPVDEESRYALVERAKLGKEEPPLILPEGKREVLKEFLSVAKSHAQIEAEGVATTLTLMLYGPPGCGKSRLARHVARELGLELYIVRLDGVISSFLGSTSKNIREVFEFASRTPGVLFLDEFDAIAKLRGDEQEHGELKRVVNSFIQNLDGLGSQSIVLAATNHEELLDRAIWRRFSYRLELLLPEQRERMELWHNSLSPVELTKRSMLLLADISEGFSGSDIHEVCLRLRRKQIASGEEPSLVDALSALRNFTGGEGSEQKFLSQVNNTSKEELTRALRGRNKKLYSHSAIGELLGVSKATAYRWSIAEEKNDGQ